MNPCPAAHVRHKALLYTVFRFLWFSTSGKFYKFAISKNDRLTLFDSSSAACLKAVRFDDLDVWLTDEVTR